jgi:hypothetical protein
MKAREIAEKDFRVQMVLAEVLLENPVRRRREAVDEEDQIRAAGQAAMHIPRA